MKAFGNVLGNSLADALDSDPLGTFIARNSNTWDSVPVGENGNGSLAMQGNGGGTWTDDDYGTYPKEALNNSLSRAKVSLVVR